MSTNRTNSLDNSTNGHFLDSSKPTVGLSSNTIRTRPTVASSTDPGSVFQEFNYNYDYNPWPQERSNKTQLPLAKTRFFGLLPIDYDGGFVVDNNNNNESSSVLSDLYASENRNGTLTASQVINNELSSPLMYIMSMLFVYAFIILVVFVFALYSHRKRIGYNYDDSLENLDSSESSCEDLEDASSESAEFLLSVNRDQTPEQTTPVDLGYIKAIDFKQSQTWVMQKIS